MRGHGHFSWACRRSLRTFVVGAFTVFLFPSLATATGPYTKPFWRYTTPVNQGYSSSHKGIDYGLNSPGEPVVASRQGVVVTHFDGYADNGNCTDPGYSGNWVLIRHADGQHTLYLHLKQNQVIVNDGDLISAGQKIATSGNSGYSCGWHLHYGLYATSAWLGSSAQPLDPGGDWTTADPGKVPFLAAFVGEHSPSGYTKARYSNWQTWVIARNDGGRTWSQTNDSYGHGRVWLGSVTSTGGSSRVSTFYVSSGSGSWLSNTNTGVANTNNVAPGQQAQFSFNLYASQAGTYTEWFNLGAEGLTYFNYAYFGNYNIPITVTPCC